MRMFEIIGDIADAVGEASTCTGVGSSLPDAWKRRAEATQRELERRRKLTVKIRDAEKRKYQQQRAAQDRQSRADDRVRALKRERSSSPSSTI